MPAASNDDECRYYSLAGRADAELNGPGKRDSLKGEISNETKSWLLSASGGPVVILKSLSISLIWGQLVKG